MTPKVRLRQTLSVEKLFALFGGCFSPFGADVSAPDARYDCQLGLTGPKPDFSGPNNRRAGPVKYQADPSSGPK